MEHAGKFQVPDIMIRQERLILEQRLFQVVVIVGRKRGMSDTGLIHVLHVLGQMWVDWCMWLPRPTQQRDAHVTSWCVHVDVMMRHK